MVADAQELNALSLRCEKFKNVMQMPNVDFGIIRVYTDLLRKLSWMGIPDEIRPTAWKLLMVNQFYPLDHIFSPVRFLHQTLFFHLATINLRMIDRDWVTHTI